MSYMDEYNKLKKKRLEEEAKTSTKATNSGGSSYMNEYNKLKAQRLKESVYESFLEQTVSSGKKNKDEEKEKDERKWYQKGHFEDGYNFGDIAKTILGVDKDKEKDTVEVYFKNEMIETIDLAKDKTYTYKGSYGTFNLEVLDGKYHAINVECPNHDCEKVGWVELGQTKEIVCVPNEIYVIQTKTDGLY